MGVSDVLALVTGVLQFPKTILEFIQLLKKTPQENHEALLKKMATEAKQFEDSGRPDWG